MGDDLGGLLGSYVSSNGKKSNGLEKAF